MSRAGLPTYLQPPRPSPGQLSWISPPTSALTSPPPAPATPTKTTKTKILAMYKPVLLEKIESIPCGGAMRGHALVLVVKEEKRSEFWSLSVVSMPAQHCNRGIS